MDVRVPPQVPAFNSFGSFISYPEVELLGHVVIYVSFFEGLMYSFPQLCGILWFAKCFYIHDSFCILGQPCSREQSCAASCRKENGGSRGEMTPEKRLLSGRWRLEHLLTPSSVLFLPCHAAYRLVSGGRGNRHLRVLWMWCG